jgi:hypothetical protein
VEGEEGGKRRRWNQKARDKKQLQQGQLEARNKREIEREREDWGWRGKKHCQSGKERGGLRFSGRVQ